jgi:hypothetical protein
MEEIHIDPAYQFAVRAYRIESGGRRRLDPATVGRVLARIEAGPRLQPITGAAQTDFVTARFNKGTGLRALAMDLQPTGEQPAGRVAMAVGDSMSDLPLFEVSTRSFAPSNADCVVRKAAASGTARVAIINRAHQNGLVESVALLLGHRPGGCPTCRAPNLSSAAERLIGILAAQDFGAWRKVGHILKLAGRDRIGAAERC